MATGFQMLFVAGQQKLIDECGSTTMRIKTRSRFVGGKTYKRTRQSAGSGTTECMSMCKGEEDCWSFNYEKNQKLCYLSSSTEDEQTSQRNGAWSSGYRECVFNNTGWNNDAIDFSISPPPPPPAGPCQYASIGTYPASPAVCPSSTFCDGAGSCLSTWVGRAADTNSVNWNGIAYGANKFVAVADSASGGNLAMYSSDGITWTKTPSASDAGRGWNSVVYGGGKFVAVGSRDAGAGTTANVMTSTDGINWSSPTLTSSIKNVNWNSVTYGTVNNNGLFVAVGGSGVYSGKVMTSGDGESWTQYDDPDTSTNYGWQSVAWGGGWFVAVRSPYGNYARIMRSSDGQNWQFVSGTGNNINTNYYTAVAFGGGVFAGLASGLPGTFTYIKSTDYGVTWTTYPDTLANGAGSWNALTYGNGLWVAVRSAGGPWNAFISRDAATWYAVQTSPASRSWTSVAYGAGVKRFVAVSDNADATDAVMTLDYPA